MADHVMQHEPATRTLSESCEREDDDDVAGRATGDVTPASSVTHPHHAARTQSFRRSLSQFRKPGIADRDSASLGCVAVPNGAGGTIDEPTAPPCGTRFSRKFSHDQHSHGAGGGGGSAPAGAKGGERSRGGMIGTGTFCKIFPFHVVLDRNMRVHQVGQALLRVISPDMGFQIVHGMSDDQRPRFGDLFRVIAPQMEEESFDAILARLNTPFSIQIINRRKTRTAAEAEASRKANTVEVRV